MPQSSVTVIQLTDPHLFRRRDSSLRGVRTWHSFERVLEHVQAHHPAADVLVVTGDLAQDENERTYELLAERMRQIDCPSLFLPGNHDDPAALHAHLNRAPSSCAPQHRFGQWDLHLLNTHVPGAVHGELGRDSLDGLRNALAAQTAAPYSALFMHHPAFEVVPAWLNETRLRNAAALHALIRASHRVRAVLCGHVHHAHEIHDQGVWMASTPSTGAQFHPLSATFALDTMGPGYRVIHLFDDGRIESDVVMLEPADQAG